MEMNVGDSGGELEAIRARARLSSIVCIGSGEVPVLKRWLCGAFDLAVDLALDGVVWRRR
jgi:hypothetical protein